jgi:hypothetical protein
MIVLGEKGRGGLIMFRGDVGGERTGLRSCVSCVMTVSMRFSVEA